ncbi:MAG: hypothetical protein V1724_03235 [Chloroflexota bacterium]
MATIVERRVEPSLLTVRDAAVLLHVHTQHCQAVGGPRTDPGMAGGA